MVTGSAVTWSFSPGLSGLEAQSYNHNHEVISRFDQISNNYMTT